MEKSELESNLSRVHEWVRTADQKIGIFLTFQGVILTLLLPYIIGWYKFLICHGLCLPLFFLIGISLLALYSIYISVVAIIPRTSNGHAQKSLLFFKDIATFDLESYKRRIEDCKEQDYLDDLIKQIHASAKIAASKHVEFRNSVLVFFVALTMFLLLVAYSFLKI